MSIKKTSINEDGHFSWDFNDWWSCDGKSRILHQINPLRFDYIFETLSSFYSDDKLAELKIIDVGCGGGILTESLTKISKNVYGIDVNEKCIEIAKDHAKKSRINVNYESVNTKSLIEDNKKFDVVVLMEVVEHVQDYKDLIKDCIFLLKDGGIIFISTINRNIKSFVFSILIAECLLGVVPKETHKFEMFCKPHEIRDILNQNSMEIINFVGMRFNPLKLSWERTKNIDVNYMLCAKKYRQGY